MATFAGHLSLHAARRNHGRTVLVSQAFRAPYHISKPYWDADARALLVQVVNPTAGILEGDSLRSEIGVQRDAALLVTTPSASRIFRMRGGAAECRQHFAVSAGGWLEVMPEPLVPHRQSRYHQVTNVEVESGGALFFVDQFTPGRIGHGEAWCWDRLCLELTVRVAGELVLRERLDQRGEDLRTLAELTGSGPRACFANAILIASAGELATAAPTAPAIPSPTLLSASPTEAPWRPALAALHGNGLWLGVSALRRGGWSLKFVASDSVRLRQALRDTRRLLASYFPRLACDARKL